VESKFSKKYEYLRFEFIDSFFYQSERAYLIGRIIMRDSISPIVIAFKNTEKGIVIDAVLMSEEEVSIVFSYTRSYYFADPNSVVGAVHFIHSILPRKPIDELYTVLGRLRQGKTERHRIFNEHLKSTSDQFVHTDGERGLVMIVFTLPSYDLVFKIIRDKFGYPKTITRSQVIEKYKLVSKHDRAGRLIDTQEFLNLKFPINRFSTELIDELLQEALNSVKVVDDNLLIKHVYIERRVRPLNLYINEVSREKAEHAVLDYGQALKDLARTNIFPGDLLFKNFGVTRHNRIIFYDYDEVSLITACNFRDIPQANDDVDELRSESWYYVAPNDMFPEEFIKFLSMDKELRSLFLVVHGELLTAEYWREIKSMHRSGKVSLVVPYDRPKLPLNN
jgi:isocitrate dehydrogenase kinase/phosphatase